MKSLVVTTSDKIEADLTLPLSKSICNRALILEKVLGNINIDRVSNADDSVIMQQSLTIINGTVDVKNAGTCMRFLTAYYASTPGIDVVLHGSERMHQRPVNALVDALKSLGADIDYIDQPGFPPLKIKGKQLNGGVVSVDASVSSQFTSALMLVAPSFKNGLVINMGNTVVSQPYISMTAGLMKQCGVDVAYKNDVVIKPFQKNDHQPKNIKIEPDWSAAGYWYMIAALSSESKIILQGLKRNSLQGDSMIAEQMRAFGVETLFDANGITLKKKPSVNTTQQVFNMIDYPDHVPALTVLMCALNIKTKFNNVSHLEAKESKRLTALSTELRKCGFNVSHNGNQLFVDPVDMNNVSAPEDGFDTYKDHRMAMAFAPLALLFGKVKINDADVVEKSYPEYWKDLERAGFGVGSGE